MKLSSGALEGILIVEPQVYQDQRGYFMETYRQSRYQASGLKSAFIQDNLSYSSKGTLRGMHFQVTKPQAKLIQVLAGKVFDVAVDLRQKSSTFGQWMGIVLSDENHRQLYVPEGFAHGFCVMSDSALFVYKCTEAYAPEDEGGVLWSDPDIGISLKIGTIQNFRRNL